MFGFLKRKKTYPAYVELPIPEGCREMTEYEKRFVVNGGGEKKEEPKNDTHTVVSGDTLSEIVYDYNKENGTNLTVSEVAKNSGISDPDKIYPGQTINLGPSGGAPGSGSVSGSSGNTPSSPSSPSSPTKINDATANTVKGPDHHSAYDQQYINEMMEKEQKNALSGSGIQGTAVSGKMFSANTNLYSPEDMHPNQPSTTLYENGFLKVEAGKVAGGYDFKNSTPWEVEASALEVNTSSRWKCFEFNTSYQALNLEGNISYANIKDPGLSISAKASLIDLESEVSFAALGYKISVAPGISLGSFGCEMSAGANGFKAGFAMGIGGGIEVTWSRK